MALLIHPGFHKTGTTYLQECVFSDKRVFEPVMSHQEVHQFLVKPHDLQFDPEPARTIIAGRSSRKDGSTVDVLSSEILSGTMFVGSRDSVLLAKRLSAVSPAAKILFTVRKQDELLKSIYLQYVKRGGRKKFEEFLNFSPEPGFHWFDLTILEFDRLVRYYSLLFGQENVLVLPQELLKQDRERFLTFLFNFCDAKGNPASDEYSGSRGKSPPASGVPLMRFANGFRRTPLNPEGLKSLSPIADRLVSLAYRYEFGKAAQDRALSDKIRIATRACFAESNERLQQFVPVNLVEFGYEGAPDE